MEEYGENKKMSPMARIMMIVLSIIFLGTAGCLVYYYYNILKHENLAKQARIIYKENQTETHIPSGDPLTTEKVIRSDILALREQYNNNEIVGYLKIEGTTIDYPVVRGSDNDFYLYNDIEKNPSIAGWIFMDENNSVERENLNTVIYGHNMNKDYMFHSMRFYTNENYFKEHPKITFNSVYDEQTWEIFSFYNTDVNFPYIATKFPDKETYTDWLQQLKGKSLYNTGVEVHPDDRILTLSTCTNYNEDGRYALHARLFRENGKETVNLPELFVESTEETTEKLYLKEATEENKEVTYKTTSQSSIR